MTLESGPPDGAEWVVGETVPWTVGWSGEDSCQVVPSKRFSGLFDILQVERPGVGRPLFKTMHATRLREGMCRQLCHVCGKPTTGKNRYLLPVQSGGFIQSPYGLRYVANVPPLHLACARISQRRCPHIGEATIAPEPYPKEDSWILPRRDVVEGMEALARTVPPNVPVAFSCIRFFGPRFTRRVARLRGEFPQHAFGQ